MTNYLSQVYDVRRYTFIPHKVYNLIPGCQNILHHLSFLSYIQMTRNRIIVNDAHDKLNFR